MSEGNDPTDFDDAKLRDMINKLEEHFKELENSANTNIAAMRLYCNNDAENTSQVVGVNLGNQRLLAIDGRTGEVIVLNNLAGKDDCLVDEDKATGAGKGCVGTGSRFFADEEIETINVRLNIPPEHMILVALTDGAWQNFQKEKVHGKSNPFLIDAEALQKVLTGEQTDSSTSLSSKMVMEKLQMLVKERSFETRKEHFKLSKQYNACFEEINRIENETNERIKKLGLVSDSNDKEKFIKINTLRGQLNDQLYYLEKETKKSSPDEKKINECKLKIESLKNELKQIPIILRVRNMFSQKFVPMNWSQQKSDWKDLIEELNAQVEKSPEDNQLKILLQICNDRIQKIEQQVVELDKIQKKTTLLERGLDDATITVMSPFGQRNVQ